MTETAKITARQAWANCDACGHKFEPEEPKYSLGHGRAWCDTCRRLWRTYGKANHEQT